MKKIIAIMMICFCTSAANAAVYTCSGVVEDVVQGPGGMVSGNFGDLKWVYICSVSGTAYGISAETCKAIYAMLLTASAGKRKVTWWFNDNLTCTTHPAWAQLTGWYYGPAMSKDSL